MFAASKTAAVSGAAPDSQFNYVTMLLHGDGTNGAQNNTFVDSSSNAFSITRNGNTTQGSFSPYGSNWSNAFNINSETNYFSIASNAAFGMGTGDYTIECWFNCVDGATRPIVDSRSDPPKTGAFLFRVLSTGQVSFSLEGSGAILTSSASTSFGTWNHAAVVKSSGVYTLYVNGTSVATASNSVSVPTSSVDIGYDQQNGNKFVGYLSNLRIVKGTAVYTSNFTPSTTPLTAISGTSLLTCQSNRFVDNSTNNFTLTLTKSGTTDDTISVQRFNPFGTSTAYSTSVIGGSGYFDGSGDYLAISNGGGSALDMGTGDCTIEMWVYPDTQSTSFPSMFAPKNGWSSGTFYIRYQSSKFGIYWNGVGDPFFVSTNTYPINSWYHVALVRSGTTFTLYVNGVSAGTGTSSATLNLAIGGEVWLGNNTSASCYYKGLLSDVRVVKGTAVYTTTFTPPTAPLTAISGTSLLTNFTNGAIYDNAMMNDLETVGNAQISTSVVKYGTGSLYFDGTGDYLQAPQSPSFAYGTGNFTIEFWAYPTSFSGYKTFYSGYLSASSAAGFELGINSSGYLYIYSGGGFAISASSSALSLNAWNHVAMVRNGSTITVYIDGVSKGTWSLTSQNFTDNYCVIGQTNTGSSQFFTGYLDDFRITKGYARYTANFTPPTAALSDKGPI